MSSGLQLPPVENENHRLNVPTPNRIIYICVTLWHFSIFLLKKKDIKRKRISTGSTWWWSGAFIQYAASSPLPHMSYPNTLLVVCSVPGPVPSHTEKAQNLTLRIKRGKTLSKSNCRSLSPESFICSTLNWSPTLVLVQSYGIKTREDRRGQLTMKEWRSGRRLKASHTIQRRKLLKFLCKTCIEGQKVY